MCAIGWQPGLACRTSKHASGGQLRDAHLVCVHVCVRAQGPDGMYVPGQRLEVVGSMADVADLMRRGKQNRSTFATNMNEHSRWVWLGACARS